MVHPQWNMLHWRPRCNFNPVCWGTASCEWGTTFVYFGITYVCFNSRILLVFAVGPQFDFFICVKNMIWRTKTRCFKNSMKVLYLIGISWLRWKLLSFVCFFSCHFDVLLVVTYANMPVAIQWPRNRAPHLQGMWNMEVWKLIGAICAMGDLKKISFPLALNMTLVTHNIEYDILSRFRSF